MVEPTAGLIPDAPLKGPADIMICLSSPATQKNWPIPKLQLLDITIPHSLMVPTGINEQMFNLKTLATFADRLNMITSMTD